jgi:hypothetical protein
VQRDGDEAVGLGEQADHRVPPAQPVGEELGQRPPAVVLRPVDQVPDRVGVHAEADDLLEVRLPRPLAVRARVAVPGERLGARRAGRLVLLLFQVGRTRRAERAGAVDVDLARGAGGRVEQFYNVPEQVVGATQRHARIVPTRAFGRKEKRPAASPDDAGRLTLLPRPGNIPALCL